MLIEYVLLVETSSQVTKCDIILCVTSLTNVCYAFSFCKYQRDHSLNYIHRLYQAHLEVCCRNCIIFDIVFHVSVCRKQYPG